MQGINKVNGSYLSDDAHIAQSISDILNTPIGSRIKRRRYGSFVFSLIDSAGNSAGALRLKAAVVDALIRWEPRISIKKIEISVTKNGQTKLIIYTFNSSNFTTSIIASA